MAAPERKHLFDNPRNVSRLLHVLYACCFILLILDFILHRHVSHLWEGITGFYPLFGFIACVSLVLIARQLRRVLKRDEDYYHVDD